MRVMPPPAAPEGSARADETNRNVAVQFWRTGAAGDTTRGCIGPTFVAALRVVHRHAVAELRQSQGFPEHGELNSHSLQTRQARR